MKCSEIQNLLSAYYDDELSADMRDSVAAHLNECNVCASGLAGFEKLSSLATSLDRPETPPAVWSAVEQDLDDAVVGRGTSTKTPAMGRRKIITYVAALAATLLIGFFGLELWMHSGHDHKEMAEAMEFVAANSDSDEITTHLLRKYGGSEVSVQDAITQVGYQPIASKGLPEGYSVEGIQVLNMPCCKCTQTACKRPDNTRFFIYEHDNEDTGWFEHQNKRQSECCGKTCEIVELDNRLAVTWQKGNRHITLLGVRDDDEIELLVSQFEEKS